MPKHILERKNPKTRSFKSKYFAIVTGPNFHPESYGLRKFGGSGTRFAFYVLVHDFSIYVWLGKER